MPVYPSGPLLSFHVVGWDWVHLLRRPLVGLLYQPRMINEYGAFSWKRTGRGNGSTWRKPTPVPLCPPQIPRDLTCDRTRVAAVGSRRLNERAIPSGLTNNIALHWSASNAEAFMRNFCVFWEILIKLGTQHFTLSEQHNV
jgi:hypothetical protein